MKYKYIIIIFAIGFIIDVIGAFFKITHWEIGFLNGNLLFYFGMFGKIIAAILLIIKLLSKKKADNFLNQ